MQNDQDDAERLLSLLEPDAAGDTSLPPCYRWGKLSDMAVAGPVPEMKSAKRGNRIVSVPTFESVKTARAAATIRWPILDRNHPEGAEQIWQAHAVECMERQRELAAKPSVTMAKPAGDDSLSSRPIRIIRR
jgi:hypothetical protein